MAEEQDKPILNYARPLDDEERAAQGEAVLQRGGTLDEFLAQFKSHCDALPVYIRFQRKRYRLSGVDHSCKGCGVWTAGVLRLEWDVRFSMSHTPEDDGSEAMLSTHHSLCENCYSEVRSSRRIQRWGTAISFVMTITSLVLLRSTFDGNATLSRVTFLVLCASVLGLAVSWPKAKRIIPTALQNVVPGYICGIEWK